MNFETSILEHASKARELESNISAFIEKPANWYLKEVHRVDKYIMKNSEL